VRIRAAKHAAKRQTPPHRSVRAGRAFVKSSSVSASSCESFCEPGAPHQLSRSAHGATAHSGAARAASAPSHASARAAADRSAAAPAARMAAAMLERA
jgi:hypothetical protein